MKIYRYKLRTAAFLRGSPYMNTMLFLTILMMAPVYPSDTPVGLNDKESKADTLHIGLQEAILLGFEHNPVLSIQRNQPKIMQTYVRESASVFEPELSASGQKSESKSLRRLGAQRTPFELEEDRWDMNAQISEYLPTGTSIALSTGMTGSLSNLYTDQYTGSVGLTVTQSLLRGLGFCATLVNLRQARLDVEISKWELKGITESVIADLEKAYWDLYLTGRETEIQQNSLELADKLLFESTERVRVGKLPRLEIAAVNAEVAACQVDLIDALSRQEQARLHFLYLLNPETDSVWTLIPMTTDVPFLPQDSLAAIMVHDSLAGLYRPDLAHARLTLKKGELEVARTANGLLPQLDVFISLGRTMYSETFKEAYPKLKSNYSQTTAGLSFSFPVADQKAAARWSRARYSREQQESSVRNMEKLVQWDVRSAYAEVLRARQQIEATRVARTLQEKKLDAETEKFRVGRSTNYLVLQAQRDFTSSQLDEAGALVSYLTALVDLYVAEGTLMERRGIETALQ